MGSFESIEQKAQAELIAYLWPHGNATERKLASKDGDRNFRLRSRGSDPAWVRVEVRGLSVGEEGPGSEGEIQNASQVAKEFLLGDPLVLGHFEQCWGALIRTETAIVPS